ncbi:hypothetical protein MA16_Dca022522 [Dendrobium catenatum]|uniref:Reverse transcriptase zinc-binding domain-containing protein n=1 Tax=Dendrobium catenatum TaxID=906689 RepID=A0A2I0VJT7_9ASPA|nr:hypothetical protein MA16_Dca022522 [Dendrobium catenatum]
MAIRGGLKTADCLTSRGIIVSKICALCHLYEENVSHIFFECDYSFAIVSSLMRNLGFLLLRPNILQLFEYIDDSHSKEKDVYFLLVCSAVYHIWRERNERKFEGNAVSSTSLAIKIKTAVLSKIRKWKNGDILSDML